MFDLWGDEDIVLRFFGHFCPRLFDINTVAYWLLEKEAHSERFLAKLRHITQVVVEIAVSRGIRTLTLRKTVSRRCVDIGVPQWFRVVDGGLVIAAESREDREPGLLTFAKLALFFKLCPFNSFPISNQRLAIGFVFLPSKIIVNVIIYADTSVYIRCGFLQIGFVFSNAHHEMTPLPPKR